MGKLRLIFPLPIPAIPNYKSDKFKYYSILCEAKMQTREPLILKIVTIIIVQYI